MFALSATGTQDCGPDSPSASYFARSSAFFLFRLGTHCISFSTPLPSSCRLEAPSEPPCRLLRSEGGFSEMGEVLNFPSFVKDNCWGSAPNTGVSEPLTPGVPSVELEGDG